MSGIFASLNTSTKGLMASQTALHTTGHNISNMNTPGFTRQRVDMKADRAFSYTGVGQLGTGVKMEAVVRMIDNHVSKQIRTENSTLNRFTEKSDVISQLEVIFNEPSDTGLSFNISEMFTSFDELAKNPGDLNAKTVAVEKLKTLTDTLNHMGKQIEGLETETHEQIVKNVLDFNSKVEQLNSLNKQIFNVSIKGQIPNDLLDQRDLLLKEVSAITEVDVVLDEYGRADIKIGEQEILSKEGNKEYIAYDKDSKSIKLGKKDEAGNINKDENGKVIVDGNSATIKIINGKILGNMDAIDDVKVASDNLDKLATTIAQAINRIHINEDKDHGGNEPIFTFKDYKVGGDGKHKPNEIAEKTTAKNINVNINIVNDPGKLQAGKVSNRNETSESEYVSGDGSLALKIARLKSLKIGVDKTESEHDIKWEIKKDGIDNFKDDPKGNTIGGSYRDMVIKIGVSKQHSDNMIDNQIALTNQLEMRRESVSGVSINDEITDVIKFQAAYEANAKVISTLAEMLDVLINRTGV